MQRGGADARSRSQARRPGIWWAALTPGLGTNASGSSSPPTARTRRGFSLSFCSDCRTSNSRKHRAPPSHPQHWAQGGLTSKLGHTKPPPIHPSQAPAATCLGWGRGCCSWPSAPAKVTPGLYFCLHGSGQQSTLRPQCSDVSKRCWLSVC